MSKSLRTFTLRGPCPGRRSPSMVISALGFAAVLGLTTLTVAGFTGVPVALADEAPPGAVIFEDDFSGPAGSPVDSSKWMQDPGLGENNELQEYIAGTDNVALDGDGHLAITAKMNDGTDLSDPQVGDFTSGRINTSQSFNQTYGHFEARIKVPTGQGIWPAFWMLGSDFPEVGWPQTGEIDTMEHLGGEPGTVHGTIHGPGYSGDDGPSSSFTLPDGQSLSDEFHTYAVDWSPNLITWTLDGQTYAARTPMDIGTDNQWVFDHPFFMILNVAVGGNFPGNPDPSTSFPQTMLVDYVRVTSNDGGTDCPMNGGFGSASVC
ncbi:glycoside hydrolase family 16 protein [Rhodococcus marinonascens]|uniref:glycoside hydrolase family 16 protein n=1 Tax=Rhodococcus marinonascens TaxID=38311 RepID=UPI000B208AB3|nr:glycoside hydrolase family 16 protein [Rhodococcus marinonascens]